MLVYKFYLVKLFPCLCKMVGVITGLSERVCGSRYPEFCSAFAAGTTCAERWSDGGFDGRHRSLHAQLQLQHWHGMPGGSVWAFHHYGECQRCCWFRTVVSVQRDNWHRARDAAQSGLHDLFFQQAKKKEIKKDNFFFQVSTLRLKFLD